MTINLRARGVEAVVLDIEGTTTPIRFVTEVLFSYARAHLRDFVAAGLARGALSEVVQSLAVEWDADVARGEAPQPAQWAQGASGALADSIVVYAEWLMDRDRKSPGLKRLQGLIWEGGYRSGALHGDVFPDVPGALTRWHAAGTRIAIYSSGSVLAQQLLFGSTSAGDLTALFDGFFDTAVGPKRESDSYCNIAAAMDLGPDSLLFVSDIPEELRAARSAGLHAALALRPGNAPVARPEDFEIIRSFDEITV